VSGWLSKFARLIQQQGSTAVRVLRSLLLACILLDCCCFSHSRPAFHIEIGPQLVHYMASHSFLDGSSCFYSVEAVVLQPSPLPLNLMASSAACLSPGIQSPFKGFQTRRLREDFFVWFNWGLRKDCAKWCIYHVIDTLRGRGGTLAQLIALLAAMHSLQLEVGLLSLDSACKECSSL
jgi:hypothetical protein